jgi:Rho-binding antiterminator
MSEDYRPIDCGLYSEYEVAIMHRQHLRVHWRDAEGRDHLAVVLPLDLRTESSKEEFLLARDIDGHAVKLRLDHIVRTEPVAAPRTAVAPA